MSAPRKATKKAAKKAPAKKAPAKKAAAPAPAPAPELPELVADNGRPGDPHARAGRRNPYRW